MSLGPSLRAGQSAAEATHTLTLTAYSPTGLSAQNETTGLEEPTFTNEGTLNGKVQGPSSQSSDAAAETVNVSGVERPILKAGLHISVSADVPNDGPPHVLGGAWEYVVTAVGDLDDPALLGRRYRVVNAPVKSFATARRLDVVEVS